VAAVLRGEFAIAFDIREIGHTKKTTPKKTARRTPHDGEIGPRFADLQMFTNAANLSHPKNFRDQRSFRNPQNFRSRRNSRNPHNSRVSAKPPFITVPVMRRQ